MLTLSIVLNVIFMFVTIIGYVAFAMLLSKYKKLDKRCKQYKHNYQNLQLKIRHGIF